MDLDDFRMILSNLRADVWTFIDAAITIASSDYNHELKDRRDGIVERLYASSTPMCRNCDVNHQLVTTEAPAMEREHSHEGTAGGSPSTPQSFHRDDDEEVDPYYGGLFDDEQTKILKIKKHLENIDQSKDFLIELLQSLADMDITFKALKETDIGRHVNRLRKHSSTDVRRLVKQLVRKWKDLVDEWVSRNPPELPSSSTLIADGDSPQLNISRNLQNGHHHQVPDFAYSPNPHNGSSGSERNYLMESDSSTLLAPSTHKVFGRFVAKVFGKSSPTKLPKFSADLLPKFSANYRMAPYKLWVQGIKK